MKRITAAFALLLASILPASAQVHLLIDTSTGALLQHTNFFVVNSNLIVQAIGGAFGGSGSGDVVGPASSTDSVVVLFNGTTGKLVKNGTLTESTIATDAEVAATYAPLASPPLTGTPTVNGTNLMAAVNGKQASDADLDDLADGSLTGSKVGTGISGDNVTTGTVADARIAATIARLASPTFTGTVIGPTASASSSNTVLATTAYVDRAVAAGGGGGGGGNASTNVAQGWSADQTFTNITVTGSATMGDLSVASISPATAIPIIHGGSGATTAAGARTNFGLIIGGDVQAYSARLADIAGISYSTGDLIYHNGSALVRMPIGTNGQVLGVSAGALTYINQTGTGGGGGVTNYSDLSDVLVTSAVEGQVPVYNGTTSKWNNRTPATNPLLVNWIGGYGIGTRTNYDVSTNVLLASFSVPPSADPAVNGRYLSGSASMMLTNATVASQVFDFRILAAGVKVAETARTLSTALYETYNFSFRVVRESATTASIYADGVGVASSSTANTGIGTFGGQVRDFSVVATNAAWDWAATNALDLYVGLNMSGTNTLIGVTRLSAGLYALVESSSKQPASSVLTNVAALTSGTSTNFLAGDGTFKQVTTNMIPGLVAALAAGGSSSPTTTRGDLIARGASADGRVAIGSFGDLLTTDGTDPVWRGRNRRVSIYDDFGSQADYFWGDKSANIYFNVAPPDTTSEGVFVMNVNNVVVYVQREPQSTTFGNGKAVFEARVWITRLSSGGDFKLRVGYGDSVISSSNTDGIWFEYTDNVNSGHWVGSVAAAGSSSTTNLSVGPSTGTWYTLRWEVDAAASSVIFSVNGANAVTLSSANIPNSTSELCGMSIVAVSSSANLTQVYCDYAGYTKDLTTAR